jgi:site-specific DNA-methyltransferase (adenine-specific)
MDSGGLSFFHSVIWDKINPGLGWRYRRQYEMVMVSHRTGGRLAWNKDYPAQSNIIRCSKPRDDAHPNIKPVELVSRFIHQHVPPDGVVLDPFMGSGTTGLAAIRAGRRFIGIEIDAGYFRTAETRINAELAQGTFF